MSVGDGVLVEHEFRVGGVSNRHVFGKRFSITVSRDDERVNSAGCALRVRGGDATKYYGSGVLVNDGLVDMFYAVNMIARALVSINGTIMGDSELLESIVFPVLHKSRVLPRDAKLWLYDDFVAEGLLGEYRPVCYESHGNQGYRVNVRNVNAYFDEYSYLFQVFMDGDCSSFMLCCRDYTRRNDASIDDTMHGARGTRVMLGPLDYETIMRELARLLFTVNDCPWRWDADELRGLITSLGGLAWYRHPDLPLHIAWEDLRDSTPILSMIREPRTRLRPEYNASLREQSWTLIPVTP